MAELQRWIPWAKDPSLATTEQFIEEAVKQWGSDKQSDFPMIVVLKATNQIIGASGYNNQSNKDVPFFEIGYWLDTQYVGRG